MKKSQKQILISSVSMLLVAVLSLSVATYTWFTGKAEAFADGISIRAERSADILLSNVNDANANWVPKLDLNINKLNLKPVSTVDCINWYTAYSSAYDTSGDRAGVEKLGTDSSKNPEDYYIAKEFYIKSVSDKAKISAMYELNVDFHPDTTDWADEEFSYIRAALGIFTQNSNGTWSRTGFSKIYGDNTSDKYGIRRIDSTGKAVTSNVTTGISYYPTGKTFLTKDTPKKLVLYVWYEGEDPDCIDSTGGVKASITLSFRDTTAES